MSKPHSMQDPQRSAQYYGHTCVNGPRFALCLSPARVRVPWTPTLHGTTTFSGTSRLPSRGRAATSSPCWPWNPTGPALRGKLPGLVCLDPRQCLAMLWTHVVWIPITCGTPDRFTALMCSCHIRSWLPASARCLAMDPIYTQCQAQKTLMISGTSPSESFIA